MNEGIIRRPVGSKIPKIKGWSSGTRTKEINGIGML